MPQNDKENEPKPLGYPKKFFRLTVKQLNYLLSIVVGFVIPILILFQKLWTIIPKKTLFMSFIVISVLGCSWSAFVSSRGWWSFGKEFLTGIKVFPHLPLEEFIFNPLGGLISILLYIRGCQIKTLARPLIYWIFLVGGTAVFLTLGWVTRGRGPYYLYSQLVLYNFFCSLLLAPFVAKEMNLIGMSFSILVLSLLGYGWDTVGFKYGWWTYYAVTGIAIGYVHIEEFNFFLFAPVSAVSIYIVFCRILKTPQYENPK
jgi:lycopene cyclase domain-containing protein